MAYFSRVILDPYKIQARQTLKGMLRNAYLEHTNLWKLFPGTPDAARGFVYRWERKGGSRVYYLVSDREPVPLPGWDVQTKAYRPKLSVGQSLFFSLRANPVVKRKDGQGKQRRHDVVMDEKQKIGYKTMPPEQRLPMADMVQRCGLEWLAARREKYGFEFDVQDVAVESYEQLQAFKPGSDKAIRYSVMDFRGLLRVTEPERFSQALFAGLGAAKAFGCGLLMVKPAR